MDYIDMPPIAPRLREPLEAALRGECGIWPTLTPDEIDALVAHGVAPLVYAVAGVEELRGEAIRAAARETVRAADLHATLECLANAGVDALLLKGSALAYDVYARPELRPRGDADLLIAAKKRDAARAALLAAGCEEIPSSGDEHGLRQAVFTRRETYDVHWAVTNTPVFANVLRFEDVRARAVPLTALGPHARGLAHPDALLLACIHRVAHHHASERLIWLVDIALLRERMTAEEHRAFWRAAAEGGVVEVCRQSIALADAWMARSPRHSAEEYLDAGTLARDEASRVFLDRSITHGGVMLANLRALTWTARLRRAWQLAFPPPSFMRRTFGARSAIALPWLYLYRGARGVRRLFRRVAS